MVKRKHITPQFNSGGVKKAPPVCGVRFDGCAVGWVERSETHQIGEIDYDGFRLPPLPILHHFVPSW